MKRSAFLKEYLRYLAPPVALMGLFYLLQPTIPAVNLFRAGLLYLLSLLAIQGLNGFFPYENLKDRPIGTMIECAILQGLTCSGGLMLFWDFLHPESQTGLASELRQFFLFGGCMAVAMFFTALWEQRKLRSS